ncbi:MAG: hypothetical protein PVF81_08325 [Thioalkalispiraceae bacterium]|jgi:uncharacterized integral membrane protein
MLQKNRQQIPETARSAKRRGDWRLNIFFKNVYKAYIGLSLILLAVIFIAQNATVVEIQLLF